MSKLPSDGPRILTIDDQPANLMLLDGILAEGGYDNVRAVEDAREAQAVFQCYRPDIVLLDLMMPHLDGFTVLRQLRPLIPAGDFLPIVVLTADVNPETRRRALAAGAVDFLTKPLDAVEVLLRVRNLLRTRELYQQLQDENHRLSDDVRFKAHLLDAVRDAVVVRDAEDRIVYWNRAAEDLYGWSAPEVLGRNANALLYPDPAQQDPALARAAVQRDGVWRGELRQTARDGRPVIVDSLWSALDWFSSGTAILVINTDVTEKKRIEADLLRMQRLEGIGALAGGIAHDLNNVLTPIVMGLDLLRQNCHDLATDAILQSLQGAAERGGQLVRQILTFARGASENRRPLEVGLLIGELGKLLQRTLPRSIHLLQEVPRELPTVAADPTQLYQVLLNLCVNARDAMPNGGQLRLSARLAREDEQLDLPASASPLWVVLEVSDTGVGMSSEVQERIFEPFFTTKPRGVGTGLGLATVREIVRAHGGVLRLASQPGVGTTFRVFLPASREAAADTPEHTPAVPSRQGQGELVLVVDDEASIREVIRATLESAGYRTLLAADGVNALDIFTRYRREIGLVLSDLEMPELDGAALTRQLRALDPQVRVVLASGIGTREGEAAVQAVAPTAFLPKPLAPRVLLDTLRTILS